VAPSSVQVRPINLPRLERAFQRNDESLPRDDRPGAHIVACARLAVICAPLSTLVPTRESARLRPTGEVSDARVSRLHRRWTFIPGSWSVPLVLGPLTAIALLSATATRKGFVMWTAACSATRLYRAQPTAPAPERR